MKITLSESEYRRMTEATEQRGPILTKHKISDLLRPDIEIMQGSAGRTWEVIRLEAGKVQMELVATD